MQYRRICEGSQPYQGIKNSPLFFRREGMLCFSGVTGEVAAIAVAIAVVGCRVGSLAVTRTGALAVATAMACTMLGHQISQGLRGATMHVAAIPMVVAVTITEDRMPVVDACIAEAAVLKLAECHAEQSLWQLLS